MESEKIGGLIAAGRLMIMRACEICPGLEADGQLKNNRRANCSGAAYEYARVRNIAQGWKRMESEKFGGLICKIYFGVQIRWPLDGPSRSVRLSFRFRQVNRFR